MKSDRNLLVNCPDDAGLTSQYVNKQPSEEYQKTLQQYWPSSNMNVNETENWELQYDVYGSCIEPTPAEYFDFVMPLLHKHNVGKILSEAKINPGGRYNVGDITNAITKVFGKYVDVMCAPPECAGCQGCESQDQYLLGVHICYNKEKEVIDCNYFDSSNCNPNEDVVYPDVKTIE